VSDALTRDELLRLEPAALLAAGLRDPLDAAVRQLAPLALAEQLRLGGVPRAALEMWIARLHGATLAAPLDDAGRAQLRRDLSATAQEPAVLSGWAQAIGQAIVDDAGTAGALELCAVARQTWVLGDALRAQPLPVPGP